jgi:hypothetical protein
MAPATADTLLKWLLLLIGGIELCAIPFIFFPVAWMDAVHDRVLGLGPLPNQPIVEYLARSLSALYAVHGAVVVRLSCDVVRFRPIIAFLGWVHLLLGLTILGTDLAVGWPLFWSLGEGPGIAVGGVVILTLTRIARRHEPAQVP